MKSKNKPLVHIFVDAICGLTDANVKVGIWDNKRFQLCKKAFTSFTDEDKQYLYLTEKRSRYHVELRAMYRTQIEGVFQGVYEK